MLVVTDSDVVEFGCLMLVRSLSTAIIVVVSAPVAPVPMLSTYPVMPDVAMKLRTRRLGLILIKIEGGGYAYVTDETFTVLHT